LHLAIRSLVLAVVAVTLSAPARAHEVLHEVQRGRAIAVRASYHDGGYLANAEAEVFSPADPAVPHWKGRTDRSGWLAFVPDAPGSWRVRVVDSTGHGLDTVIEVAAPGAGAGESGRDPPNGSSLAVQLRPVMGVLLIAAIFGLLLLRERKRRR
jgi:nickel transport protein